MSLASVISYFGKVHVHNDKLLGFCRTVPGMWGAIKSVQSCVQVITLAVIM